MGSAVGCPQPQRAVLRSVCVCVRVLELGTDAKLLVEGRAALDVCFYFILFIYIFFNRVLAERVNAHGCPERTHEPLSISKQDEVRWKRQRYGWKGTEKAEGQRGHGMCASPPAASLHGDVAGCWDVHRKTRRGKKQRGGSRRRTLHLPLPLVSLKQPRPWLLALLRSQQRCWLHFPQPAPLIFAAVFIAQLLL